MVFMSSYYSDYSTDENKKTKKKKKKKNISIHAGYKFEPKKKNQKKIEKIKLKNESDKCK